MVLQSSGEISFANIQTEFGGTNPISLSEYYQNATPAYTSDVSGIPNIGSEISLNQFYGKAKPPVINMTVSGNQAISYTIPTIQNVAGSTTEKYIKFLHQGSTNAVSTEYYTDYTISFNSTTQASLLLVGGGGGGGSGLGSGGGGGGLVYIPSYTFTGGVNYKVRIGSGGLGMQHPTDNAPINGSSSIIFDNANNALITALGGARGNGQSNAYNNGQSSRSGGCGAGGVRHRNAPGSGLQKTSGGISSISKTNGYGNNGGSGKSAYAYGGGGGGGAGGIGGNADAGVGGNALITTITGNNEYYAAGGGGGTYFTSLNYGGQGAVGTYVGGQGSNNGPGGHAVINTGSGGGGAGENGRGPGGNGSAGICIIKAVL